MKCVAFLNLSNLVFVCAVDGMHESMVISVMIKDLVDGRLETFITLRVS